MDKSSRPCDLKKQPISSNVIDIDQSKVLHTGRSVIGSLPSQRMYERPMVLCVSHTTDTSLEEDFQIDSHTHFKKVLPKHERRASRNGDSRNECLLPGEKKTWSQNIHVLDFVKFGQGFHEVSVGFTSSFPPDSNNHLLTSPALITRLSRSNETFISLRLW